MTEGIGIMQEWRLTAMVREVVFSAVERHTYSKTPTDSTGVPDPVWRMTVRAACEAAIRGRLKEEPHAIVAAMAMLAFALDTYVVDVAGGRSFALSGRNVTATR